MEIKKERKYYFRSFENCGFVQAHQTTKQISGEKNSLNLMSSILMKTNSHMYTPCKYHAEAYRIHNLDPSAAFFAFRFFFIFFLAWQKSLKTPGIHLLHCSSEHSWLGTNTRDIPAPPWSGGPPDLQTSTGRKPILLLHLGAVDHRTCKPR